MHVASSHPDRLQRIHVLCPRDELGHSINCFQRTEHKLHRIREYNWRFSLHYQMLRPISVSMNSSFDCPIISGVMVDQVRIVQWWMARVPCIHLYTCRCRHKLWWKITMKGWESKKDQMFYFRWYSVAGFRSFNVISLASPLKEGNKSDKLKTDLLNVRRDVLNADLRLRDLANCQLMPKWSGEIAYQ